MKPIWVLGAAMGLPLSMGAPAVVAHHSTAMFDMQTAAEMEGEVKDFQWTNPHGYVVVTSDEDDRDWVLELPSIPHMASWGIRDGTFKPGERITVTYNPVKTGKPAGQFVSATIGDGHRVGCTPTSMPPCR